MKMLFLLSMLLVVSCKQSSNFDFLMGKWERTNEEQGKRTFETWMKQNDSTYIGHGYTLHGADTVWQENIIFSPIEGIWHYQVLLPDETQSTNFRVTKSDRQSFTCENPQNEFPKSISYRKADTELHAEISGGGTSVKFLFGPVE